VRISTQAGPGLGMVLPLIAAVPAVNQMPIISVIPGFVVQFAYRCLVSVRNAGQSIQSGFHKPRQVPEWEHRLW
jgi:hypothetical protein